MTPTPGVPKFAQIHQSTGVLSSKHIASGGGWFPEAHLVSKYGMKSCCWVPIPPLIKESVDVTDSPVKMFSIVPIHRQSKTIKKCCDGSHCHSGNSRWNALLYSHFKQAIYKTFPQHQSLHQTFSISTCTLRFSNGCYQINNYRVKPRLQFQIHTGWR